MINKKHDLNSLKRKQRTYDMDNVKEFILTKTEIERLYKFSQKFRGDDLFILETELGLGMGYITKVRYNNESEDITDYDSF